MPHAALKNERFKVEAWMVPDGQGGYQLEKKPEVKDADGNVVEPAKPYVITYTQFYRPATGGMPEQVCQKQVDFTPSDALVTALEAEVKVTIDAELAQ